MKKLFFFLCAIFIVVIMLPKIIWAQNYNMTNGTTINTCGGFFYDTGGPSGNYQNTEALTETFCSCNSSAIRFTFTSFNIENIFDHFNIHDGNTAASPLIGTYSGSTSPGTVTSTNPFYCLTFVFQSDNTVTYPGWSANISCLPGPAATIAASGPTTFCQGGNVTLTANSGSTYSWSTGANTQSINVSTSGNYFVSVTNTTSCTATSNPMNVTVKPSPTLTVTGSGTICSGGSQTLTASGASSYTWSPATTLSNSAVSNPVASPSATTTYSVTGTGANGCTKTSTVTVTVSSLTANAGMDQTICSGHTATLSATGGTNYSWNTGDTDASIMVTPVTTTIYTVLVSNAGGCSGTDSVTVTVDSCVTGIFSLSSNMNTIISPNPTTGKFYLSLSPSPPDSYRDRERRSKVEIYNVMGEKIYEVPSDSFPFPKGQIAGGLRWAIDISSHPPGIYFVNVVTEQETAVQKIVKQ